MNFQTSEQPSHDTSTYWKERIDHSQLCSSLWMSPKTALLRDTIHELFGSRSSGIPTGRKLVVRLSGFLPATGSQAQETVSVIFGIKRDSDTTYAIAPGVMLSNATDQDLPMDPLFDGRYFAITQISVYEPGGRD